MSEQYPVGVYSNNGTFLGNATTIDEFARLRGETKEESRRLLMNMGFVEVIEAPNDERSVATDPKSETKS